MTAASAIIVPRFRIAGRTAGMGDRSVEMLLFTALAAVLYLVADRVLDAAERRAGRRFEYRSVIFFTILLVLALAAFALVRRYGPGG